MRVVFMGTPAFAVPSLEALDNSDHEVVGVVMQPDRPKGRGQAVVPCPVKELGPGKRVARESTREDKKPGIPAATLRLETGRHCRDGVWPDPSQSDSGSPAHGMRQRPWFPVTRLPGSRPDPMGAHSWGCGNGDHHDAHG